MIHTFRLVYKYITTDRRNVTWTKIKMERPIPIQTEQALNGLYPVAAPAHE
jgi:hypothetical protein